MSHTAPNPAERELRQIHVFLQRGSSKDVFSCITQATTGNDFGGNKDFLEQLRLELSITLQTPPELSIVRVILEVAEMLLQSKELQPVQQSTEHLQLYGIAAAAAMQLGRHDVALQYDLELLQMPQSVFCSGLTLEERLSCTTRALQLSQIMSRDRVAELALRRMDPLGHIILNEVDTTQKMTARELQLLYAALREIGYLHRAKGRLSSATSSFRSLYDRNGELVDLKCAVCCALCISDTLPVRQGIMRSMLRYEDLKKMPDLRPWVVKEAAGEPFSTVDVDALVNTAAPHVSADCVRRSIQEYNIACYCRWPQPIYLEKLGSSIAAPATSRDDIVQLLTRMARAGLVKVRIDDKNELVYLTHDASERSIATNYYNGDREADRRIFEKVKALADKVAPSNMPLSV